MRKLLIALAVLVVIVIGVLAIAPSFLDVNRYHDRIQSELQSRLGRPVTLGNIRASFLPPSLKVKDVNIGEDPQFGPGPFARAQQLNIRVALLPLLRKDVEIQSLSLENPDVELIRNNAGEWNYSTLGKPAAAQQPAAARTQPGAHPGKAEPAQNPAPASKPSSSGSQLSLAHLQIDNGRVHFVDQKNKFQATYENIDVTLNNFEPGKPFDVDATVHVAGKSDQQIHLAGTAGPIGNGLPPFDGTVDLKQISIADLRNISQMAALNGYNGVISGSMKATARDGNLRSQGSLKISDPELNRVALGYPITLDYKMADNNAGVIKIDQGTLHLGPTPITIQGTFNSDAKPPQVDMHVTADNASIAELARLAAAMGVAFNPGMQVKGQMTADITARGTTSAPALQGNLRASSVEVSGGTVKEPVRVPQVNVTLTPTAISTDQFQAQTGGTTLNLQVAAQNYTSPSPMVNAKVQTSNADIAELLSMARAYGISAADGIDGTGHLGLNMTASGPMKNTSAMVFDGSGAIQNASLKTPELAKPLNIRNADIKFSQNSMMLNNLNASLDQTNATGNMSIRDFAAPQVQFALNADKMDLEALQQIVVSSPQPQRHASLDVLPRAYAAVPAPPEPSLLSKATGGGTISIGQLSYDQLLLQNVHSQVALDHGIIHLSPLTSTLYGGQQSGSIVFDTRATPPAVTVSSKLDKVDANQLISSTTSLKQTIYGLLAANANTTFRAASAADVARTLNGTLALDLSNGKIARIDMLNQLASIGRFVNSSLAPSQPFTAVTKMSGNFNVVNGLAQTNNLRIEIPGANLATIGSVNLATNALDLHVTAVLSQALSQKAGGTGIGGFMQTALANKQGELVMPILITGTFDHPSFAPDVQQIAQMKLQNLLPSFGNPGNMTQGLLGAVLGGKNGQQPHGVSGILGAIAGQQQSDPNAAQQQPDQQQQQPNVNDLLNQVLGKKKKKQ